MAKKQRVLIFIISYNHETLLTKVLERIPASLANHPAATFEILIIEDCSADNTFKVGYRFLEKYRRLKTTILSNPVNQGFGGNQKLGYQYAIDQGFDHVVLLHGDGQYAPELIPQLVEPLLEGEADAVFGSRMINPRDALKGGMPLYKWVGNKILTHLENWLMSSSLSEWHSGYRLYSVAALKRMPFQYNSNYYDFDTHIIIQLLGLQLRIHEIPIPTFYGMEVSYVNGWKYALKIILACMLFKAQDLGIFYHPRFYLKERYQRELKRMFFDSSVSRVVSRVRDLPGPVLMVIDPARVEVVEELKQCGQMVTTVPPDFDFASFAGQSSFKTVIFMDSFESVPHIEEVLDRLRHSKVTQSARFFAVGPNVGFLPVRLALLFGQFNYGVRGILDFRHRRLFTFSSVSRLLQRHGYRIRRCEGIPVPWPLAFHSRAVIWVLSKLGALCLKFSRGLFAYQYFFEFETLPTLEQLLLSAHSNTAERVASLASEVAE